MTLRLKANRRFPSVPNVVETTENHTQVLMAVKEALDIGQRRTGDLLNSFIRVEDLIDLGLITIEGNTNAIVGADLSEIANLGDLSGSAEGDFLRFDGTDWVNDQLALSDITQAMVTQHQAALALTSSQVVDFGEAAQDAVGGILVDSSSINFTYDDAFSSITADIDESFPAVWTASHRWVDAVEVQLGTGGDLRLFHDGTNSIIRNDAGSLSIFSGAAEVLRFTAANPRVQALAGAVGTPAFSFFDDPDTGLYRIGANNLGISVGAVAVVNLLATAVSSPVPWTITQNGTSTAAPLTLSADTTAVGGNPVLFIDNTTASPAANTTGPVIRFRMNNSANSQFSLFAFRTRLLDPTAGSEDSQGELITYINGTSTNTLKLAAGLFSPNAADMGIDTFNALHQYEASAEIRLRQNVLVNGGFSVASIGTAALNVADAGISLDRWNILTQTANVTVDQLSDSFDGSIKSLRITQPNVTSQRFGLIQILTAAECKHLRGKQVNAWMRVKSSAAATVRLFILEWTGAEDTMPVDVVNTWSSTTFTINNFFINNASLTIQGPDANSTTAATWSDNSSLAATIGSTTNNIAVFAYISGVQLQNATLEIANAGLMFGSEPPVSPFIPGVDPYYDLLQNRVVLSTTNAVSFSTGGITRVTINSSGQLLESDGTVALPGGGFISDPDTGRYRIGANNMGDAVNGTLVWEYSTTRLRAYVPIRLTGYTVATLPAGTVGDVAYVTDALTPAFLVAVVGGGAVKCTVFYDGANWVVQ